ncbi:unknown [Clostridium sp. CAG:967]|nr:unknown [Clostridium sp. CAG:967]
MSLLIFAYRKLDIMHRKNDLNYRLMNLTRKLSDLQQYAANIADGSVSMSDMMNTPSSMFGRQMMYMQYAHNGALFGAQQKMAMMQPQIAMQMQQMQDPNYQAMYQQWIFKSLYDQERERMGKQETKLLNEQEKQIQAEKAKLETQLKLLDQELEACKQGEDAAIKQWKPEYTA